jgi:hypothetical protein
MNETVKPPTQIVILFGFWATLRREAYSASFLFVCGSAFFKARVSSSSAYCLLLKPSNGCQVLSLTTITGFEILLKAGRIIDFLLYV